MDKVDLDLVIKTAVEKGKDSIDKTLQSTKLLKSEIQATAMTLTKVFNKLSKITDYTDDTITSFRLLKTTLGDATTEANGFINKLSEMSGLNETVLAKQTAKFVQLGESLSFSNIQAEKFSENLSVLSTKLAMLYNIDYTTMANALQKAVQGSQVTLKSKTGIAINDMSLQATLNANAIDREVSSLNDAEKAILRYATILRQVSNDNNVYQNAVNSLAWQKQMLTSQIKRLASAVGQLLTPAMTQLYIVMNAVVMAAIEMIKVFGSIFNIGIDLDSNVESVADGYDDLGASIGGAAKEAKKSLRGFDMLNNITTPTSGSGGGGAGLGIDDRLLGLLGDADSQFLNIKNKATEIRDIILEWFGMGENKDWNKFGNIMNNILKVAELLGAAFFTIKNHLSVIKGLGLFVIFDGVRSIIEKIIDMIKDPSIKNFSGILKGISETLFGGSLIAGITQPLGQILAIVGQIFSYIGGILEWVDFWIKLLQDPTWENFANLLPDAVHAYLSSMGLVGDVILWLIDTFLGGWDNIEKQLSGFGETVYNDVITPIIEFFTPIGEWINENVLIPIQTFFNDTWKEIQKSLEPLITEIEGAFKEAWEVIQIVWNNVYPFFEQLWTYLDTGFKVAWETIAKIWNMVTPYFEMIWNNIQEIFSVVGKVIGGFFSNAWEGIKFVWNTVVNYFTMVWAGIKAVFSVVKGVLTGDFTDAKNAIENVWNKVKGFFEGIWNGIKGVFSHVTDWFKDTFSAAWNAVKNVFSTGGQIFEGIKDGIGNVLGSVINAIIRGINSVIAVPFERLNSILRSLRQIEVMGLRPFSWISTISVPQIPAYENGGFPEDGFFFANHNELVGKFANGDTAVANNKQIIEGIEGGVFNGMMSALANADFGGQNITIEANGDTEGLLNFIEFKQKQKIRQFS